MVRLFWAGMMGAPPLGGQPVRVSIKGTPPPNNERQSRLNFNNNTINSSDTISKLIPFYLTIAINTLKSFVQMGNKL
jgi:hypothetical protein